MYPFHPAAPQFGLQRSAPEVQPRRVHVRAQIVRTRHPDHHGRSIGHQTKTLFTLAYLLLHLFLLSDINSHSQHANGITVRSIVELPARRDPSRRLVMLSIYPEFLGIRLVLPP